MDDGLQTTLNAVNEGTSIPTIFDNTGVPDQSGAASEGADAASQQTDQGQSSSAEANAQAAGQSDDGIPQPYHKDPAWQRIISERNAEREKNIRLEERNKVLEELALSNKGDIPQEKGESDALAEVLGMDDEALTTMIVDKPKEFTKLIAEKIKDQAVREAINLVQEQTSKDKTLTAAQQTFQNYEKENPDFRTMWDSGELKEYMRTHPGHNAISAHMALTSEARISAAVEKAQKDAIDKTSKTYTAKQKLSTVLGAGPAAHTRPSTGGIPKELANSRQYGGTTNVLANRLEQMRAGKT